MRKYRMPERLIGLALTGWLLNAGNGQAAAPVIANVTAAQQLPQKVVNINYDVSDSDSTALVVSVLITTNNAAGTFYDLPVTNFSGNGYGSGVTTGTAKQISWNVRKDMGNNFNSTQVWFHVAANDGNTPTGFVRIPSGSFTMGDTIGDGLTNERPTHFVFVSEFYMEVTEVRKDQWDEVRAWAITNGYSFTNAGVGTATNHPVRALSWYDCIKWCNARSEKDGLTPCYYTNAAFTADNIYRTGEVDIATNWVNWNTNGYRLATEAEWEKAARGGVESNRFQWADSSTITHSRANYYSTNSWSYDVSPTRGYHPIYGNGTAPVGSFSTNGYGLYDMAGNVSEWCWDRHLGGYYSSSPSPTNNPYGPDTSSERVFRSGNYDSQMGLAYVVRPARRTKGAPHDNYSPLGFRCVRSQ